MRVLIVCGSIPEYRKIFYQELAKYFSHLTIVSPDKDLTRHFSSTVVESKNIEVILTKAKNYFFINRLKVSIRKYLGLLDEVDVVVVNPQYKLIDFTIVAILCRLKKKPLVFWGSNYDGKKSLSIGHFVRQVLKRNILKTSSLILSYGYSKHDFGIEYIPKVEPIGNSVNNITVITNEINFDKVFYWGRLDSRKNLKNLMTAIKQLRTHFPNITLQMFGDGPDWLELKYLTDHVPFITLSKSINLLDCEELFLEGGVFILPGAGGLAVNDAIQIGLIPLFTEGDGSLAGLSQQFKSFDPLIRSIVSVELIKEKYIELRSLSSISVSSYQDELDLYRGRFSMTRIANQWAKSVRECKLSSGK